MAVTPVIQHGEPQCRTFWKNIMKDAVRYKETIRKKNQVKGKVQKDKMQKKANVFFNRFKKDLGSLSRQCGLPQDTCATFCNAIKVEDREV